MPCSDGGAYDYINDPRTGQLENEINSLKKTVAQLSETPYQKELTLHKERARTFAEKLNNVTALLCKATHLLVESAPEIIGRHQDLMAWYDKHQDEDAERMLSELDKIFKKTKPLPKFVKWYTGLSSNELEIFNTRKEFINYKF